MGTFQIKCIHNALFLFTAPDHVVNKGWKSKGVAGDNCGNQSPTMETPEEVPMRVAPASIIASTVSRS